MGLTVNAVGTLDEPVAAPIDHCVLQRPVVALVTAGGHVGRLKAGERHIDHFGTRTRHSCRTHDDVVVVTGGIGGGELSVAEGRLLGWRQLSVGGGVVTSVYGVEVSVEGGDDPGRSGAGVSDWAGLRWAKGIGARRGRRDRWVALPPGDQRSSGRGRHGIADAFG